MSCITGLLVLWLSCDGNVALVRLRGVSFSSCTEIEPLSVRMNELRSSSFITVSLVAIDSVDNSLVSDR